MPRIVEEIPYNGVSERIQRLGLSCLLDELRQIVTGFELRLEEKRDANGGAAVRKLIDLRFESAGGWTKTTSGDVDWVKCHAINGTRVCIGVEVQFSARSDLLVIDIIHLRKAVTKGVIDVAVLIVPSDRLAVFLTDRCPSLADAKRHVFEAKAEDLPLLIMALEHDGPGDRLAKQKRVIN